MTAVLHIPHVINVGKLNRIATIKQISVDRYALVQPQGYAFLRQVVRYSAIIVFVYFAYLSALIEYAV